MTVSAFDPLAPGAPAALVLLSSRITGMMLVAPVFSSRAVPMKVRTAVVLLFTVLLHPVAMGAAPAALVLTLAGVLGDALAGLAVGMGAAVLVGGAEVAGELISIHSGLSGAALLDPLTRNSVPVLGQLSNLFAVSLLLATDGHLAMVRALSESLEMFPVGTGGDPRAAAAALVSMGGSVFVVGMQFAGPVVAAVLVANVAIAMLGRVAPSLNVLSVAFPVQIAVGLFTLSAALPYAAPLFAGNVGSYAESVVRVLGALGGGGR